MWRLTCLPEYARFQRATRRVKQTQDSVLREILRTNADCEFGRSHNFEQLSREKHILDCFRDRVAVHDYDDVRPQLDRIALGAERVLTSQHVLMLEPTGGSKGGAKLIPYTRLLRRQFQRGIAAWIANLLTGRPALKRGRAYWSISPALDLPRPDQRWCSGRV